MSDAKIENNFTEIHVKRKDTMKDNIKGLILIIIFFIFLIVFAILYPYVLLFMNLDNDKIEIFISYFRIVFPVISAFAGVIIGYFFGQKRSD